VSDQSLASVAYKQLRNQLLNGEYLPGTLLSESELASKLGMSRTPIRAAISQLEQDGYVQTLLKRGILVKGIDIDELYDMFDLLDALYMFALDRIEEYQYQLDLEVMRDHLNKMIEASEQKQHRAYYEHGLLFMSGILTALENRSIQETFDRYKDKILFYVVSYRSTKGSNRPYTGRKLNSDIYVLLTERKFQEAKLLIREHKRKTRDGLLRGSSSSS
jgi:DNA-binding GntR family transcriptional regulator